MNIATKLKLKSYLEILAEDKKQYFIQYLINTGMTDSDIDKIIKDDTVITKELLSEIDEYGYTLAYWLSRYSYKTGWRTDDPEILKMSDENGITVAHNLALLNPSWTTDDIKILKLHDNSGWTVAHELARSKPSWTTSNPKILNLTDNDGVSVKDVLLEHNKLNRRKKLALTRRCGQKQIKGGTMKKIEYKNKIYSTRKFLTKKIIGSIIRENLFGNIYLTFNPEEKIFKIDTSGIILHKFPQYQDAMNNLKTIVSEEIDVLKEKIKKFNIK